MGQGVRMEGKDRGGGVKMGLRWGGIKKDGGKDGGVGASIAANGTRD